MKKNQNTIEIPLGLNMALAKNYDAMNNFVSLTNEQKQKIINKTHQIKSKNEMQNLASQIAKGIY